MTTLTTARDDARTGPQIDPGQFRSVLGRHPTGVAVVTALDAGRPTGFAVGTFTSISLDPPLVGFFPDQRSSTFAQIRDAGAFCANVLSARDSDVCRAFATKGVDRFAGLSWRHGPTGSPVLDAALAWVDCTLEEVREVGDHFLAVGRVVDLGTAHEHEPLIFHRGAYASCAP